MALVSPGVEVTIIDESQYLPPASSSVPFILLATAQNKANGTGTAIAPATTAANANKLYTVTSQRDLVNLFGNPFFYKTSTNTPIQGYELNEYGLLAAYSLLGATNRCFILRADIDLASLVGTLSRPLGEPDNNTYWLDTVTSTWGLYVFNAATGKFTNVLPIVVTDSADIVSGYPASYLGNIGSYAVIPGNSVDGVYAAKSTFYKNSDNVWVSVVDPEWQLSIPTISATPTGNLNASTTYSFTIMFNGDAANATVISFTASAGLYSLQQAISNAGGNLNASITNGSLNIFCSMLESSSYVTIIDGANSPFATLGLSSLLGVYHYLPEYKISPSSNMPLWTTGQNAPHPTGSLWIKTSVSGNGINPALNVYKTATATWNSVTANYYSTTAAAIYSLDSTGGKSIPVDTVIQTTQETGLLTRKAVGPTVATGTVTDPSITIGSTLTVLITVPGVSTVSSAYTVTTTGSSAMDFLSDWQAANIPYTSATTTASGAIQLIHTEGGDIYLSDINVTTGFSNGLLDEIGFNTATNTDIMVGYPRKGLVFTYTDPVDGNGDGGATFDITINNNYYSITRTGIGIYGNNKTITIPGGSLGGTVDNDLVIQIQENSGTPLWRYISGVPQISYFTMVSNWEFLTYTPNEGALAKNPANGTNWYYSTVTEVDIMVNKNGVWKGYRNVAYDSNGHPLASGVNTTDPNGPIMATSEPTTQTNGDPLAYGDLWIDTNDLENYPMIYRWQSVDGTDQWVQIDVTDQVSQNGIVFADARWANSGTVDPVNDPIVDITTLLTSNYLDLDAPNGQTYPQGMLLWNTRRSGYNVKQFKTNYFTQANYPGEALPSQSYTWVSVSGLQTNGAAYMGRKAQRNMVVQAMKAAIGTNQTIREEDTFFNLVACPNYPELQPDMVVLNNDRNNTAYIIGDTPLRLPDQATALTAWATNAAGASSTGEDGLVTRNEYMGLFYPSGITVNPTDGSAVVVPASHMMLRTFLRNDTIAYPWLAPAGTRRGNIDNATNIGYLDATTGEFVAIKNRMGIRDVLYTNQINPLAYFTGVGLLNYGNKNSKDTQSALDRINVARLVCYIRERLQVLARPFVFEPNDSITRNQISGVVQSLFIDLVAKRGLYDYLVVCDESNNTPARIDRNQLWIDVAIEPVKAAEFIYIPVRVLNTGEIAGNQ